ncbi:YybH family protein [Mesorhizobium sp. NBSH29]|uniref:YybH family protein n=1 Tax=Mesorhizobium sp. NBSH29 TaxID=2654249 RepID=UPI0018964812|nr:DUF4440 domain-containing protein [Mesorhizobium sp. NBSH29]
MNETNTIQAVIDTMAGSFGAHDIPGVLATYEPGAVVVGAPGVPESGKAVLQALFQRFIDVDPKFTFHGHEIFQSGDIALHLSRWSMTGMLPGGSPLQDGGLSAVVLRKQTNGQWLMVIDNPYGDHLMKG